MAEPTDEQLRDYTAKMPKIYKDILLAFPGFDSKRREFDSLETQHIMEVLTDPDQDIRRVDVNTAITQLSERGFLSPEFYRIVPTRLGERAIKLLSGTTARPAMIPSLPEPSWAS